MGLKPIPLSASNQGENPNSGTSVPAGTPLPPDRIYMKDPSGRKVRVLKSQQKEAEKQGYSAWH
jgi:hypothetical protein